jgi:ribosomal protein L37AE/L43A
MSVWYCARCNVRAEQADDIRIFYKDIPLPEASGYRCPSCGFELLDGSYVVEQLSSAEEMLEGK